MRTRIGLTALLLAALLQTPAAAAPVEAGPPGGQYLMILARDGAFAGQLWSLAGRSLAIDPAAPGTGRLLTRLTDAHGWSDADRAHWQRLSLEEAVQAVCADDIPALATMSGPDDIRLAVLPENCRLRMIDLGDGVSRAFAEQAAGLASASIPDGRLAAVPLGADTILDMSDVQVADRAD